MVRRRQAAWSARARGSDAPAEQIEPIIEQLSWRLPTAVEWEWIARAGGTTPFINGSTFEEAEAACTALYDKAYDPERDEFIMQMAGMGDDGCAFDEQCLRFVLDVPAL